MNLTKEVVGECFQEVSWCTLLEQKYIWHIFCILRPIENLKWQLKWRWSLKRLSFNWLQRKSWGIDLLNKLLMPTKKAKMSRIILIDCANNRDDNLRRRIRICKADYPVFSLEIRGACISIEIQSEEVWHEFQLAWGPLGTTWTICTPSASSICHFPGKFLGIYKGRHPLKEVTNFRALPESGGEGLPMPKFVGPFLPSKSS